ncbi:P-loop containing nucleoside triphosphate hydrolase protein [Xylariaceae sp. AK1471]|nr:P-loop containing nucleoside triphosphate hydrolase protein [Xylariaceae sp. AK1471]
MTITCLKCSPLLYQKHLTWPFLPRRSAESDSGDLPKIFREGIVVFLPSLHHSVPSLPNHLAYVNAATTRGLSLTHATTYLHLPTYILKTPYLQSYTTALLILQKTVPSFPFHHACDKEESCGTILPKRNTAMSAHEKAISIADGRSSSRSQSQSTEARRPRNFAHPAFTDIGMKLKACNDTLGEIQLLGVSHVAVLPELVLVGDQSSGKSSLMSALARLNLPTSSVRQSDVTKRNSFPPWAQKPMVETKVFKTIYEQDSIGIEEVLRWAQVATLNPSQNPEQYVPSEGIYAKETDLETARRSTEARFSPNIVSLEMKGPGFPDLSLYDLPGVFAIAEAKGDDYLVDVVENLTRKYVDREKAIIMLALPMDHDLDNSRTLKIIRDSNAETRTIGVLTKADRPNFNIPDTVAYWLAVLEEKKQTVGHGFFTTSLPPDEGLDTLTAWEDSFFRAGVKNWPRAFDNFVHRCGVDELRVYITKKLGEAFASSLPEIKEKFETRIEEIEGDLMGLPELPRNVEHEVRMSLRDFYNSVKCAVGGPDFEQDSKALNEQFHRCLMQMKPKCIVTTEKAKPRQEIVISDDSDNPGTSSRKRPAPRDLAIGSTPKKQRRNELLATPVKGEGSSAGGVFQSPATPGASSSLQDSVGDFSRFNPIGSKLSLLEIQREIKHKTRGGFGDVVPLEVHEALCLSAVSRWKEPLDMYIDKALKMLMSSVTGALKSTLGTFSRRLIFKESEEHLMAILKEQGAIQSKRLKELSENEMYKAVTINEDGLNHFKAKEKEVLERYRLFTRARAAGLLDEDRQFDDQLSPEEEKKCLGKLPQDEFKREIDVAAKVRGYYITSATRFVDGVSMDINSRLFRSFREGGLLESYLDQKLGLFPYPSKYGYFIEEIIDADRCEAPRTYSRLMEEEETTAQKREQLKKEREKLRTARQRIDELERSTAGYTIPRYNFQRPTIFAAEATEPNGKMENI